MGFAITCHSHAQPARFKLTDGGGCQHRAAAFHKAAIGAQRQPVGAGGVHRAGEVGLRLRVELLPGGLLMAKLLVPEQQLVSDQTEITLDKSDYSNAIDALAAAGLTSPLETTHA